MNTNPLSYLESFNARHLSASDVAREFVAPAQFFQLLGLNHCVLIGPRGSGKTTLLKMLQADSSSFYLNNPDFEAKAPAFIGVFVPADVRWARQLDSHVSGILSEITRRRMYEIAFGTSVLLATLETIEKCIEISSSSTQDKHKKFQLMLERKNEVILVQRLAELWATPVNIPSLSELKHRLRLRQVHFPNWTSKIKSGTSLEELAVDEPYLSLTWLDAIVSGIETINEFIGQREQRWALLLDELEIVPASLLQSIVSCLRSTSTHLIFKLALSPSASGVFSRIQESEPTQGNDFKILNLWYNERDDLRNFASRLLSQALRKRGIAIDGIELAGLLGHSSIYEDNLQNGEDAYASDDSETDEVLGSKDKRKQIFTELSAKDSSFQDFLHRSKIHVADLDISDAKKQGPLIRKILPLVQFRNRAIKEWSPVKPKLRSGKVSQEPYSGFPNILDLTEGNPRWVLNLADLLDAEFRKKGLPISAQSVQSAAIAALHQRFAAMLKIYPVQSNSASGLSTIYEFVERLAGFIKTKLYFEPFSADPAQSFEVDVESVEKFGVFLESAIHLGALVIMNPESPRRRLDSPESIGLVGARLRLCYRLAPEFFLPLRSTGKSKLSSALKKKSGAGRVDEAKNANAAILPKQAQLF